MYMTGPDKATPLGPVFEMNIVCFVLKTILFPGKKKTHVDLLR